MKQSKTYPQKLSDRLWLLGNHHFNLYFLQGDRESALIELGVSAIAGQVVSQLTCLNLKPDYLILTHPHTDHLTGIDRLRKEFPKAKTIVGSGALEFLAHPKAEAFIVAEDRQIHQSLERIGFNSLLPPIDSLPIIDQPLVVERPTKLDLGGIELELLPVSGHAPGQIMVNVPALRTLFPSDALGFYFPGRCILPLFFTGYAAYCDTLRMITDIDPQVIGIPHQGPIRETETATFLNEANNATHELFEMIKADHREANLIARELFMKHYRDEFLLYSEANIQSCMDLLVKRIRQENG